jgi:CRISPR-associated endonuclease/helicase Cas3
LSSFQLKSRPNQLLVEHLSNVAENCERLAPTGILATELEPKVLKEIMRLIGASHDVGKATRYFQEYLVAGTSTNPLLKSHSTLSSLYAYYAASKKNLGNFLPICSQLIIQAHHGKLQSRLSTAPKLFGYRNLIRRQIDAVDNRSEIDEILGKLSLPAFSEFSKEAKNDEIFMNLGKDLLYFKGEKLKAQLPFLSVNFGLSVLVDADRMDAAGLDYPKREEISAQNIKNYVKTLSQNSSRGNDVDPTVIKARDLLFENLASKAMNVPLEGHIFSITAPTGYGKTLAAFHFALKLRERLWSQGTDARIVYVAPFLSVIDQNFNVIQKALRLSKNQSNLLLAHHHLADMNYQSKEADSFDTLESELLIEGWNAEIVVTTFVQFFSCIIGNRASQLRKFHNLENAIILLDEVQSIPHEYWKLVRDILAFFSKQLNIHIILMTATQPLIFNPDQISELVEDSPCQQSRVHFEIEKDKRISLDDFCKEAKRILDENSQDSCLIVMNTIKSATQVYNSIGSNREKYNLSANITPKQRRDKLEKISNALKERRPIVLVSTQVVEAGVDLDFDRAIRDIGPIDSIIQVAGRCNRNGSRDSNKSVVLIYNVVNSQGVEFARQIYGDFLIEKSKEVLFNSLTYDPLQLSKAYYQKVRAGKSDLKSDELLNAIGQLDYQKLEKFQFIEEQDSASVYVEINQEAKDIWNTYVTLMNETSGLKAKEKFLQIRQTFYDYVINAPEEKARKLELIHGFYVISTDRLAEFYDYETGFRR